MAIRQVLVPYQKGYNRPRCWPCNRQSSSFAGSVALSIISWKAGRSSSKADPPGSLKVPMTTQPLGSQYAWSRFSADFVVALITVKERSSLLLQPIDACGYAPLAFNATNNLRGTP
jgi:hypothetical protein